MMKQLPILICACLMAVACSGNAVEPVEFVDLMIGAGGHGHVFVGATVPHGMVQLGPHQPTRGWDWCSGYHVSDTLVFGFSHSRLSGTGIGELGDVMVMPLDPKVDLKVDDEFGHVYASLDHSLESMRPGFYSLDMPDYGVKAELTATERVGYHRYTFSSPEAELFFDLDMGTGWDRIVDSELKVVDSTHVVGYRRSTGWAKDQIYYFAAEFSEPIAGMQDVSAEREFMPRFAREHIDEFTRRHPDFVPHGVKNVLSFELDELLTLEVKVALSGVSEENAMENLGEIPAWDFDVVAEDAYKAWKDELSVIEIDPLDERVGRIFYTSLYHYSLAPYIFSDPDGSYRGADGEVHHSDTPIYTVFSLWDTYRAAMPLASIIDQPLAKDIAQTFLKIYHEQGKLPVWHLCGNETDCMVGNPGVIVMGDFLLKGLLPESQWEEVLEAMVTSSMLDERGMELLKKYGFLPFDVNDELETVSRGMEFAISDAAVERVARFLGDGQNEQYFAKRAKAYSKYFDSSIGFMRGRASDGSFRKPYDPFLALHEQSDFTEGNGWQYTFLVPHDVHGLAELFGTEERFREKLDSLFIAEGDLGPRHDDVTGLIGQYAHGNEPSHHVVYMYNYIGRQWRCAELVRYILNELYDDQPDGLCGNEDVGQMSAWYVLSALGLYQADPINGTFLIGSPVVHSAKIHLGEGKTFEIVAKDNSVENIYVQSAKLNGKELTTSYITYKDIVSGGRLELQMGPAPSRFGTAERARP
ncbi:MAG: GH92 family glycosyl hydrolase [Bacteroidales bacterium]|nr:GH92 family glycosyl hydrolase [Bacteroidales bacterium]